MSRLSLPLISEAESLLLTPVRTVLEKKGCAASGDRHDYYSIGRYYWPPGGDPSRLPWILRDGEISPAAMEAGDFPAWGEMGRSVETLAWAWAESGDARFAQRAAQWLRIWFVEPSTRMNPHFGFSAAAPGYHTGGGIGVIEAAEPLTKMLNGVMLLEKSGQWGGRDREAFLNWIGAFHQWLRTTENASRAFAHPGNIGTWSEALMGMLGLYLRRHEEVRAALSQSIPQRVEAQILPSGEQPHELRRTLAFHYSLYNLEALLRCMELAACSGAPEEGLASSRERVEQALEFLVVYPADRYIDLRPPDRPLLARMVRLALTTGLSVSHSAREWLAEPEQQAALERCGRAKRFYFFEPMR